MELDSELDLKRVGQGHQPVDQAVQLSDFQWRVTLVEELDGEFEAVVFESLGVVAVLLGAEVGGDDEEDLLVAIARVVEIALEVDGFADAEVEGDAAAEGLVVVRCGTPFSAGVTEDGQSEGADAVFVEDAVVVGEKALRQVGVIVHLDLDVDVKPLVGTVEEADFEKFVDPLGCDFGGRGDFVEFLLEEFGFDRPIDAGGDLGKGDLEEGPSELVDGVFPGAVVIERLGHVPSYSLGRGRIFQRSDSLLGGSGRPPAAGSVPHIYTKGATASYWRASWPVRGGGFGQASGCAARRQGMGFGCAPLPGRWGDAGGALSPKAPREGVDREDSILTGRWAA